MQAAEHELCSFPVTGKEKKKRSSRLSTHLERSLVLEHARGPHCVGVCASS